MIRRLLFSGFCLLPLIGFAQTTHWCGTPAMEQQLLESNPTLIIEHERLNAFIEQWLAHNAHTRDESVYVIPVVFHIIHDYGSENISDEQVRDAIRILNEDFRKRNSDTTAIVPSFKQIAADCRIEFRLANKTPGGMCTNGIEHIHSLLTYVGGEESKLGYWPRDRYLNIWTVKNLTPGVAGYAYLPGSVSPPFYAPYDGIMILSNYVGSIGTSSPGVSRALTHEVGHYLNLHHPWGPYSSPGVECGDDAVDDTPETKGWTTCKLNGSVCNPPIIENVQNYMEYAYCSKMFTHGQAARMQATLNASAADRNKLWQASNLAATGTDDLEEPVCVPRVDFYASTRLACVGDAVTFFDVSWNGPVETREWQFADGEPSTSTAKNPVVVFTTPGWKTVTLTCSNSAGTATETRTQYIYISDQVASYQLGYWETFENPAAFQNDWVVLNPEGNNSKWQYYASGGYNSSGCVRLNNFQNMNGDVDVLVTPSINLTGAGTVYLNFWYSAASNAVSADNVADELKIYVSTNCGRTWTLRQTISGVALANAGYYSYAYTPGASSPWVGKSVLIPSAYHTDKVKFKFEYRTNGRGNNLYLDEIAVVNYTVGIPEELSNAGGVWIYPNPMTDRATVEFALSQNGPVRVVVSDLMGVERWELFDGQLPSGTYRFSIDGLQLSAGQLYYVSVRDAFGTRYQKLIKF